MYGKEAVLPPNIYLLSLHLAQSSYGWSSNFLISQIDALLKLEEEKNKDKEKFHVHQQRIKILFNKHAFGNKLFQVGDLVLKWDKYSEARGKHSRFQQLWLGPFVIVEKSGDSTYHCQSL